MEMQHEPLLSCHTRLHNHIVKALRHQHNIESVLIGLHRLRIVLLCLIYSGAHSTLRIRPVRKKGSVKYLRHVLIALHKECLVICSLVDLCTILSYNEIRFIVGGSCTGSDILDLCQFLYRLQILSASGSVDKTSFIFQFSSYITTACGIDHRRRIQCGKRYILLHASPVHDGKYK